MPALREMREDIPLIAKAILIKLCHVMERDACSLKNDAMNALTSYDFPGNVRELENILERTLALCADNKIDKTELQLNPVEKLQEPEDHSPTTTDSDLPLQDYLDQLEKESIEKALEKNRYNRTAAARLLGITVRSMRYRMERLGMNEKK